MTTPRWFTWGPPRPQFVYPAGPPPRVAVVHENLRVQRPGMTFHPQSHDLLDRLIRFRPNAFAGRHEVIASLAAEPAVKSLNLRNAVIVFREPGEAALDECRRNELWRLFQVPVFEQILSAEGDLIAYECEAHSGLHIGRAEAFPDTGLIDTRRCECGDIAPRITSTVSKPKVRSAAA